jgi:plastocyanin
MMWKQAGILAGVAVAAAGLGTWAAMASGSPGHPAASTTASPAPSASSGYSWYQSMMGSYSGGTMMGGSSGGQMMSPAGYRWMTGGVGAPGWMRGGNLPSAMMGTGTDPGKIMGRLWADAPGSRVSASAATRLGSQIPAGARINRAADTLTFTGAAVRLTVVASPPGGRDETFRVAGMTNPGISVRAGAQVSIQVINADPDTAHGLVVTASKNTSWMPMMTDRPAFPGSAVWFLGDPATDGMHAATLTFTAGSPGAYHYLCPVPGHTQKGMTGAFTVK